MNPDSSTCCYNVKAHVKPYIVLTISISIISTMITSIVILISFNIIIIIIIIIISFYQFELLFLNSFIFFY